MTKAQTNVTAYRKRVVRGNKLMTAKFNLSLSEYKVLLMTIHNLQTSDKAYLSMEDFKTYVAPKSKNAKKDFIDLMERLTDKSVYIGSETATTKSFSKYKWLSTYTSEFNKTGKRLTGCYMKMEDELKAYLLDLDGKFTTMYLTDIFQLQSFASVRIFEILSMMKRNGEKQSFRMTLANFRSYAGISPEEYTEFKYLNNQVIKKVVKELNGLKGVEVDVTFEKEGKSVTALIFNYSIKEEHQTIENPLLSEDNTEESETPAITYISSAKLPEYVHITTECEPFFNNDFGYIDFTLPAFGKAMASAWLNVKEYTKGEVVTISNYEYFRTTLNKAISNLEKFKAESVEESKQVPVLDSYYYDWISEILA